MTSRREGFEPFILVASDMTMVSIHSFNRYYYYYYSVSFFLSFFFSFLSCGVVWTPPDVGRDSRFDLLVGSRFAIAHCCTVFRT